MKFRLLILIATIPFGSCNDRQSAVEPTPFSEKLTSTEMQEKAHRSFLDTVITISDRNKYSINSKPLSDKEAESLLYDHFRSQGVISRSEWQVRSTNNEDRIIVEYDSLYRIQTENLSGALISYWLGTVDLNGHCFQPKKAIALSTPKGYRIIEEEFIPTSFVIDSTRGANIYGEEYECGGRGTLRKFRIVLRRGRSIVTAHF